MLALAFASALVQASSPGWRVKVGVRDMTTAAAPIERGGSILLNLSELARFAGVDVMLTGATVRLRDGKGREWVGRSGEFTLLAPDGLRVLSHPLLARDRSVYAPIDAVAEVLGLDYRVQSDPREVRFLAASVFAAVPADPAPIQESSGGWRIKLGARDVTAAAAPIEHGGSILLNLSELARSPGVDLSVTGPTVRLRNGKGQEWIGRLGEPTLLAPDGLRILSHPLLARDHSVYAPVDAVAEVLGLDWRVQSGSREVRFAAAPALPTAVVTGPMLRPDPIIKPTSPPTAAEEGWREITLDKTAEEKQSYSSLYGPPVPALRGRLREVVLPPDHGELKLQVSQGYVQGADWGTDLFGSGSFYGFQADLWAQTTMGPKGFEFLAGRFSLGSPDKRWTAQGGDLVSEIWGWARGARLSWKSRSWHAPSLSYYAKTDRTDDYRNVLTYSDYFRISPWFSAGGELSSDGSVMVRPRFQTSRLSITPFYRLTPHENLSRGVYGSLSLWRRTALYGSFTRMRTERDDRTSMTAGVRVPLVKRTDLTLEHTKIHSSSNRTAVWAAALSIPAGPLRLYGRYQYRDNHHLPQNGLFGWLGTKQHEFFGGASYFAGSRLSLQLQTAARWRRDGAIDQWQQITGHFQISRKSLLEGVSVLPDATTPSQNRVRFTHRLKSDLAVVVEYGNVSPYQGIEVDPEDRRLKIMLRKQFNVRTPARGADVGGVVADPLGQPVESALVRLGDYAALTDKDGRYGFKYVPPGTYKLGVDDKSLPADYSLAAEPRTLEIRRDSTERLDWTVVPFNTIPGRVCEDKDGNGACDPGEGIEGLPVLLGARVTATGDDGAFLFHNVLPGLYLVKLDVNNLPKRYAVQSEPEVQVAVEARKPTRFVQFFLKEPVRQIIFQELP